MDIKVDYAQLPAGPTSGQSRIPCPSRLRDNYSKQLREEQAPLRQQISTYMPIYTYFSLA